MREQLRTCHGMGLWPGHVGIWHLWTVGEVTSGLRLANMQQQFLGTHSKGTLKGTNQQGPGMRWEKFAKAKK